MSPEATLLPLALLPPAAILWYFLNRLLFGDVLSPFSLIFLSWIAPLFLQAMNLSVYETAWSLKPALIVAWTTCALVGPCLLAAWFVRPGDDGQRATFAGLLESVRRPGFLAAFFALYAFTFATYLYAEFLTNPAGVPLFTILSGELPTSAIHRWGKDTPLTAITALLFVLTPLAYLAYLANRHRPTRWLLLAASLLFPIFGVLKLSRSDVFVAGIGILAVASYHRRWAGTGGATRRSFLLKAALLVLAGLVVGYAMMAIRVASVPFEDVYAQAIGFRMAEDAPLRGIAAAIYGYAAMPFENLNRFLAAHDGGMNPGISALRPFLSVSGMGDVADRIDAGVHYPTPATFAAGSATFLTAVYAELGAAGAALVPVAYAVLVNALYIRMRARPCFRNLFLYINFLYPWLWLFFNNGFGVLSFYLNAAFIVAAGLLTAELWPRTRGHTEALGRA